MTKNYPYPEIAHLLQFHCSTGDYDHWTAKFAKFDVKTMNNSKFHFIGADQYYEALPTYKIAECPYCSVSIHSNLDTYSLRGELRLDYDLTIWKNLKKEKPCEHYLGNHRFLNLHQKTPADGNLYQTFTYGEYSTFFYSAGEIPFVPSYRFEDSYNFKIVMHALPICDAIDDQFVPHYTLFIVNYFADNTDNVIKKHNERNRKVDDWPASFLDYNVNFGNRERYYPQDLDKMNMLYWLDFEDENLKVNKGLPDIFKEIEGDLRQYKYKNGNVHFFDFDQESTSPY